MSSPPFPSLLSLCLELLHPVLHDKNQSRMRFCGFYFKFDANSLCSLHEDETDIAVIQVEYNFYYVNRGIWIKL